MFRFEHIEYAWALLLVPVLVLLFILARMWRKRALQRFGDLPLMQQLTSEASAAKPVMKLVLLLLALVFLIIGMMNPQIGSKVEEVKREGADIMIAIDVSNSMKAEDLSPSRLEKAKQSIEKLLDKLQGDRIGIVVFAGDAFVQLPITTDYAAAKLFLQNIDTDIVPVQGTAIGPAIYLAAQSFSEQSQGKNRAIIVITDGETHEQGAVDAAKEAGKKGIIVHTIGMGSAQGAPIPVYKNKMKAGFHRDEEGNTVITKLNEAMLQDIAEAGEGIYVRASNAETGLNIVISEINKLEKKEFESRQFSNYDDRFYYFIAVALLLLVLESLFSERRSKWIEKLDLFGERRMAKK